MSQDNSTVPDLGLQAYGSDEYSNGDLLKNLEDRHVDRFAEGTEEHAGTALMGIELHDGMLGVQVSMEVDSSYIRVYPEVRQKDDGSWLCESLIERRRLNEIEELCPDCEIVEVVQNNIMDPDEAEVLFILNSEGVDPFAINMHLDENGQTEFFEL